MKKIRCSLGIDIGSTKIASVLYDPDGQQVIHTTSAESHAYLKMADPLCREQDVEKIYGLIQTIFDQVAGMDNITVCSIGFTGQMHGVLGINKDCRAVTNLVTWEDKSALAVMNGKTLIDQMNEKAAKTVVRSGFGLATLYRWLHVDQRKDIAGIATIPDYIIARTCGMKIVTIDPTFAHSLGGFNVHAGTWDAGLFKALSVDSALMPTVVPAGSLAGYYEMKGARIPVMVSLGDNQAAFIGAAGYEGNDMLINIGTGAQVCYSIGAGEQPMLLNGDMEIRPFVNRKVLLSAASLNGGNVYKSLYEFFRLCGTGLLGIDKQEVTNSLWERMEKIAESEKPELKVEPLFNGLRSNSALTGSVSGITSRNFTPAQLIVSTLHGLAEHYRLLIGEEAIRKAGRIVGSGNAIKRNPLYHKILEQVFGREIALSRFSEEAAVGAAMLCTGLTQR